jgi:hypothetical protein
MGEIEVYNVEIYKCYIKLCGEMLIIIPDVEIYKKEIQKNIEDKN